MILSSLTTPHGTATVEYHDADSFDSLPAESVRQAYGVCYTDGRLAIALNGAKQTWGLVGGTIEAGENYREALEREIREESNMRVIDAVPIGYQKLILPDGSYFYQLRYACRVEAIGPFVEDPAGSVTEIRLIDPADYKQYFDWGEIGERIMERARQLLG